MARRLSESEIDLLKRTVTLSDLVEASGIKLERHGKQLVGRCPWHGSGLERTPSLVVSVEKNLWNCMAGCGGGSSIDFVMKRDNISFVRAVEAIRAFGQGGAAAPEPKRASKATSASTAGSKRSSNKNIDGERRDRTPAELALLNEVTTYATDVLKKTPRALSYMERRGLVHPELIDRFRLGFSDQTLSKVLPPKSTPEGAEKRRQLEEIGVLRQVYEHFAGSLVMPILDEEGQVLGIYGRRISPPARGVPVHRYLPGPHRGVFNVKALALSEEIVVCEAIIDALTCISAEIPAISAYGVEGFGPDHFAALERFKTKRVLIAYDRDAAGDRGAEQLGEKLTARGIACYRVELPKGMDINEYALALKPAEKSLALVMRKAVPMLGAPARPIVWSASTPGVALMPTEPVAEPPDSASSASTASAIEAPTSNSSATDGSESSLCAPIPADEHSFGASNAIVEEPAVPETFQPKPSPIFAAALPAISPKPPKPPPSSSPLLPPVTDVAMEERGEEVYLAIDDRRYRVRGLAKNTSMGSLRVNLLVARGEQYFMDSLDLCLVRPRAQYERLAAVELGLGEDVMHRDVGKVLRKLEELQSARIGALLEPKSEVPEISPEDHAAAMALLQAPDIFKRIETDLESMGVVGEVANKLLAFVAMVSRKMEDPLAVIIQSSSAAGKSRLMDGIFECAPPEERMRVSAMTPQALYYMRETELCHKVLAICEEEGAERASYPLKLLQSEHELVIAATTKNQETGELQTKERRVKGPVMIFLTTTAIDVDEELLNRAFVLTVDEDREQTQAIHRLQRKRETIEGIMSGRARLKIVHLHQNAQRLLRPVIVANPYAESLTFSDARTRTRRDHMKYLALIRAIALLRQYQKQTKTVETELGEVLEYIEVEPVDIEMANRLMRDVLSRTLSELPPQTERLLAMIDRFVSARAMEKKISASEVRFTRREIREATGFGNTQLKTHLKRLEDLEHLVLRGGREYRFEYQLLTPVTGAGSKLTGSASVETPKWSGVEATRSGVEANTVGPKAADGRGESGVGRPSLDDENRREKKPEATTRSGPAENHVNGAPTNGATNGTHAGPVMATRPGKN